MTRAKPPTEAAIEKAVILRYVAAGFTVYKLSQGFRKEPGGTRQTPGLPDLLAFRGTVAVAHETKNAAGLASHLRLAGMNGPPTGGQYKAWLRAQAQRKFAEQWRASGNSYAIGGVPEAETLLGSMTQTVRLIPPSSSVIALGSASGESWGTNRRLIGLFEGEPAYVDDSTDAAFAAARAESIPKAKRRKGRAA